MRRAWLKARPSLKVGNTSATSARRSRWGASSATLRLLGQMTPVGPSRRTSASASARKRAAETITGKRSGTSASSATRAKPSATMRPSLMSCMDALLERLDADAFHGLEEDFPGPLAQLHVSRDDVLDHVDDLAVRHRGTQQRAELRVLVGAAGDRDLIILLAVLLDAEDADVADVVMATRVDAAGNVDVQPVEAAREIEIAEPAGQFLRDRDRARIGEAAIVEARAGDDVRHQPDVGGRDADRVERTPQRVKILLAHVGQHEVLLVADADFAGAVAIGEVGNRIYLIGGGIAGRFAFRLERQGDDGVAGHAVARDRIAVPGGEPPVGRARLHQLDRIIGERSEERRV